MNDRTVSAVRCENYSEEAVRSAFDELLAPLGDLDFIKPGMTVAIKVNLVTAAKPDRAATTHPALVCELCRRIAKRGAAAVVGDSPGGPFTGIYLKGVYSATQMTRVEEYGGRLNRDFGISKCGDFPEAAVLKSFEYTSWLKKADVVINFAKLKTHGMMGMSAAVKNLFGAIPGTVKPEYHYRFPNSRDFANMLIDIDEFFKPCLNIVDGVIGMEGNGPTMGTPKKIGVLAASASPYDLDVVCAKIIGLAPDRVPTCQTAIERGLGGAPSEIAVTGSAASVVAADFKNIERPNSIEFFSGLAGFQSKLFNKVAFAALCTRPTLCGKDCVGCKKCADICPASAIVMKKSRPHIDRNRCIRCFCCQEFCPRGAMRVHRPLPARLLTGIPSSKTKQN